MLSVTSDRTFVPSCPLITLITISEGQTQSAVVVIKCVALAWLHKDMRGTICLPRPLSQTLRQISAKAAAASKVVIAMDHGRGKLL